VSIGLGEVALDQAVGAFVLDDEREMRGHERSGSVGSRLRAEEDGEGVSPPGLEEDGAVGDLIEFGGVHEAPEETVVSGQLSVVSNRKYGIY
jgi:hypothetical protein